jgi:hypothetical protein
MLALSLRQLDEAHVTDRIERPPSAIDVFIVSWLLPLEWAVSNTNIYSKRASSNSPTIRRKSGHRHARHQIRKA